MRSPCVGYDTDGLNLGHLLVSFAQGARDFYVRPQPFSESDQIRHPVPNAFAWFAVGNKLVDMLF